MDVHDINELLEKVVHPLEKGYTREWIQAIKDRSEGNPLYLKMLCEELFSREVRAVDANRLPPEIESLWENCFDRLSARGDVEAVGGVAHVPGTFLRDLG